MRVGTTASSSLPNSSVDHSGRSGKSWQPVDPASMSDPNDKTIQQRLIDFANIKIHFGGWDRLTRRRCLAALANRATLDHSALPLTRPLSRTKTHSMARRKAQATASDQPQVLGHLWATAELLAREDLRVGRSPSRHRLVWNWRTKNPRSARQ